MKRFICIINLLCLVFVLQQAAAQPTARRAEQAKKDTGPTLSVRAQTQYTGHVPMPEEVIWKREIYRELDLKDEKNSALYYPVDPIGNRTNLFTLVFKLMTEGKIKVYEYRMDGNEDLSDSNVTSLKDVMDRFHIYYDEAIHGRDTVFVVDNSDIPSGEVLSYYIKEDWYFDQRTSTYNSRVVAICPVIHRAGDFSMETAKYPMFWFSYKDLSPYLGRMPVMTSNLNNTANITIDDYFTSRLYKGDIYKTTNMLNMSLEQYSKGDTAILKREQARVEEQLQAFNNNLWESTRIVPAEKVDTTAIASKAETKKAKAKESNSKRIGRDKAAEQSSSSGSKKVKEEKPKSSSSSSSARVSVRRQRR